MPEAYTGQIVSVRIDPDRIVCYADGLRLCEHQRQHGFHQWCLKLEHYLHCLHRKPGALSGSVALKQSESKLQEMYQRYYCDSPKDFIELLLYMKEEEKGFEEIDRVISKLTRLGCFEISTDKIKLACAKHVRPQRMSASGEIDQSALSQLTLLAGLIPDNSNLKGEAIL